MPRYDYNCKKCNTDFYIISGINDNRDNVKCSECGSLDIKRIFNSTILKGKKARGYVEETSHEPDKEEHHEHIEHAHCSPDLDYL